MIIKGACSNQVVKCIIFTSDYKVGTKKLLKIEEEKKNNSIVAVDRRKEEHKLTKEEYLKMYKEDKLAELCEQFEEERDYYHNEMLAYKSDAQSAQKKLEELSSYWESMDKLSKKLETLPAKDFIKLYYIMHGMINDYVRYSNINVRAIEPDSLRGVTTAYN